MPAPDLTPKSPLGWVRARLFNTPLNSVLGYTQLLLLEELPPAYREKLAIVESQVKRMIETVQRVLARTRQRRPSLREVRVDTLVDDALTLLSARIGEASVVVERQIPEGLPTLTADGVGLRQVLVNLLTNAIDASQPLAEWRRQCECHKPAPRRR